MTKPKHPHPARRAARAVSRLGSAVILISATLAPAATAQPARPFDRVLLDDSLRPSVIRLISVSGETIVYEDERGRRRQATVGGFVGLLPPLPADPAPARPATAPADPAAPPGVLELTDGQRFPGVPAPTGGGDDSLEWDHPIFGRVAVPLDSIARVAVRRDGERALRDPANDQLILINGDRLVGFIERLGDPIEIEIAGDTVEIPFDRLLEASLANPAEPMSGLVIWLEDGTVAVVASLETRTDETVSVLLPGGQSAVMPLSGVRAIAFDAGRLVPLASVPITGQTPIGVRGVFDRARTISPGDTAGDLGAPDIELPGPMRVTWVLPAGSVRLAAVAELPLEAHPWGDFELVISQSGVELTRERINLDRPRVEISLAVRAGEIAISIEPGAFGPISDRLVLRRPIILSE